MQNNMNMHIMCPEHQEEIVQVKMDVYGVRKMYCEKCLLGSNIIPINQLQKEMDQLASQKLERINKTKIQTEQYLNKILKFLTTMKDESIKKFDQILKNINYEIEETKRILTTQIQSINEYMQQIPYLSSYKLQSFLQVLKNELPQNDSNLIIEAFENSLQSLQQLLLFYKNQTQIVEEKKNHTHQKLQQIYEDYNKQNQVKNNQNTVNNQIDITVIDNQIEYIIKATLGSKIQSFISPIFPNFENGILTNRNILNYDAVIDETLDQNRLYYFEDQQLVICFKFYDKIYNLDMLQQDTIKQSLQWSDKRLQINEFIDEQMRIANNSQQDLIYKQFELNHIIAIKIWCSNLINRQLNIDLKVNNYGHQLQYLKYLLDAFRICNYYRGTAFRGINNFQELQRYQQGGIVQWSEISSLSKSRAIAGMFCNIHGMIFEIDVMSAKDISYLSMFVQEEEVIMLPYSTYFVKEVNTNVKPIIVKLQEFPIPRSLNIILWIDQYPENNYNIVHELEKEIQDIQVLFCISNENALILIEKYSWMLKLQNNQFRIVININQLNQDTDLLGFIKNQYAYEEKVLVLCQDLEQGKQICQKSLGNYRLTNEESELKQYIRLK